jgi:hypothetical protein
MPNGGILCRSQAAARIPRQRQARPANSVSYVPDHVRNPHKYTCYTLDEPIFVGGGDRGSADEGKAEMERVSRMMSCQHLRHGWYISMSA